MVLLLFLFVHVCVNACVWELEKIFRTTHVDKY